MNQAIEDFIRARRIALVGASLNPKKFGHVAFRELARRGYEMVPVHLTASRVAGVRSYQSLQAVEGTLDGVLVAVPPARVPGVLRDAAAVGVKNVWLQSGTESAEAVALGRELGLHLVAGKCILMYAPPVGGFHRVHRTLVKLVGRL